MTQNQKSLLKLSEQLIARKLKLCLLGFQDIDRDGHLSELSASVDPWSDPLAQEFKFTLLNEQVKLIVVAGRELLLEVDLLLSHYVKVFSNESG